MNDDVVGVRLSRDEALVLFEWLQRVEDDRVMEQVTSDEAEGIALANLLASLEPLLVEPFRDDYRELVEAARARLRATGAGAS